MFIRRQIRIVLTVYIYNSRLAALSLKMIETGNGQPYHGKLQGSCAFNKENIYVDIMQSIGFRENLLWWSKSKAQCGPTHLPTKTHKHVVCTCIRHKTRAILDFCNCSWALCVCAGSMIIVHFIHIHHSLYEENQQGGGNCLLCVTSDHYVTWLRVFRLTYLLGDTAS